MALRTVRGMASQMGPRMGKGTVLAKVCLRGLQTETPTAQLRVELMVPTTGVLMAQLMESSTEQTTVQLKGSLKA